MDDDDESGWTNTGQTFAGKGAQGEETLFTLQRKTPFLRVDLLMRMESSLV